MERISPRLHEVVYLIIGDVIADIEETADWSGYEDDEDPEAFEAYEATFPHKEKAFQEGQLPQFCQSCGMPLTADLLGTNADGSKNMDYCIFCYKDGRFLQDVTMEGMIDHCLKYLDEMNQMMPAPMTAEEYRKMALYHFPMLKRWRR